MRTGWIVGVAMVIGCSSESGLHLGLEPKTPVEEEPDPPAPPAPDEPATLRGTVCSPNGAGPVTHADVTVMVEPEPVQSTTDASGLFVIDDLPPGTWEVVIEKGSFVLTEEVVLEAGRVTNLSNEDECVPLEQGDLEIAVVTGLYDKIEDLLDGLGLEYDQINGKSGQDHVDLLLDPARMAEYDLIFFNCGMQENWLSDKVEIADNLRDFVKGGGSLYASDWAFLMVEGPWGDQIDFLGDDNDNNDARRGNRGDVDAVVLDPAMVSALGGDQANLHFDLWDWVAMEDAKAEWLLEGDYKYRDGAFGGAAPGSGPMAVRFHDGDGTVVYTSFHNENQTTGDMLVLLEEIIFSL